MNREVHVRFWESARVRFPRATQLFSAGISPAPITCSGRLNFLKEVFKVYAYFGLPSRPFQSRQSGIRPNLFLLLSPIPRSVSYPVGPSNFVC